MKFFSRLMITFGHNFWILFGPLNKENLKLKFMSFGVKLNEL
jgi:hypothetical protein